MVTMLEAFFPGLRGKTYRVMSPRTPEYNCIAWAAGISSKNWWPSGDDRDTWPAGIALEETVSAFRDAFGTLGYTVCNSEDLEPGFEKTALFANEQGVPQHAARQLTTGRWTSKIGALEDIEHDLHDLAGAEYGSVVLVMRREIRR